MDRHTYLENQWIPYPPAPPGSQSLGDYEATKPGKQWVVGRFLRSTKRGGENSEKNPGLFRQGLHWGESQLFLDRDLLDPSLDAPPYNPLGEITWLEPGDLVALCRHPSPGGGHRVSNYHLLAPRLGPSLASPIPKRRLHNWSRLLHLVREYFYSRGFLEVSTPLLVDSPGTEAHLKPLSLEISLGSQSLTKYLPTSPEFHLKRAWSMDLGNLFEIQRVFRDGELTHLHQIEFSLLEWYESFKYPTDAIQTLGELLAHVHRGLGLPFQRGELEVTSWAQIFRDFFDFDLKPHSSRGDLAQLARSQEVSLDPRDSWADVFHRIVLEKIEPQWKTSQPLVVRQFPPELRAFSRIDPEGWADRFELYWRGVELCNGFHEINDPRDQLACFVRDLQTRQKEYPGEMAPPIDHSLIQGLQGGSNPGVGVALGLDRLFMLLFHIENMDQTRLFPLGGSTSRHSKEKANRE